MKIFRNILLGLVIIVIVLVAVGAFMVNQWTRGPLPNQDGTFTVEGLNESVTVTHDDFGVAHIYASNIHDLRFAQGYVQAQDRWWQMEFWRHTGAGRIQELTGQSDALTGTDIFIRTIGWEESAIRDIEAMSPETLAELQSFADGVNAYIMNRSAGELAFEYNVLGLTGVDFEIEPWTPLDTVVWTKAMAWDLSGSNRSNELTYSAIAGEFGDEMADLYQPDFDYENMPPIIHPEELPSAGEPFAPPIANTDTAGIRGIDTQLAGNYDPTTLSLFGFGDNLGSNNWVVSGELTESGQPLLANDPHLGIQNPSIWYEIGLYCQPITTECPYSNRGYAFASSPGIIIGHNDRIGWGVTNLGPDVLDLYRMEFNPDNDLQYMWDGEWRDAELREEVINYGDGGSITIQVRVTHLGAIINDNQIDEETGELMGFNNDDPLALRWTADETGTIIEAILRLNRANDWDEFRDAIQYWDIPAQSIVYADVDGNIGYQTQGRIPIRVEGHTGLMPVDGTTSDYEWLGYVPYEYMPSVYNPERGWIATANQAVLPQEYYSYLASELGAEFGENSHYVFDYDWAVGYRGTRINEMIEASDQHNTSTFRTIHGDNKFLFAEDIAPYLSEIDMGSAELNEVRDWMLDWDYQMHMDSPQAALFAIFWDELSSGIFADELEVLDRSVGGNDQNMYTTSLLMEDASNSWWDNIETDGTVETRDDIIVMAFSQAYDRTVETLGDNRDDWRWGALHTATFVSNPLGLSGIGLIEDTVNITDIETSGGTAIVNATSWSFSNGLEVSALPSLRMILDFANLDNSLSIHTTGQSGHPMSPHYSDMVEQWRMIEYNPMLYSPSDVDANARSTFTLEPAN
ncbi:MAG: penicillin acylase family protein [Phototrophicaceae bacterium]